MIQVQQYNQCSVHIERLFNSLTKRARAILWRRNSTTIVVNQVGTRFRECHVSCSRDHSVGKLMAGPRLQLEAAVSLLIMD